MDAETTKVAVCGGVSTICRVRPTLAAEARMDNTPQCILCRDDNKVVVRSSDDGSTEERTFSMDAALGPEVTQSQLYSKHCKPMLKRLLKGYNATIWSHGQTGAGKTYTMEGPKRRPDEEVCEGYSSEDGAFQRVAHHLYKSLNKDGSMDSFRVTLTMIQVYNGRIHDLLASRGSDQVKVKIRETIDTGVYLQNCIERSAAKEVDLKELFEEGCRNRDTGVFMYGRSLARSTCIYTVKVVQEFQDRTVTSKLNFVDSCGTERVMAQTSGGLAPLKEGAAVSKSMTSLGLCLAALASNQNLKEGEKKRFVPYRDCPVTHYLRDSLGGNAYCLFIVCVSPSSRCRQESTRSLEYARRTTRIANRPIRNITYRTPEGGSEAQDVDSSGESTASDANASGVISPPHPVTLTVEVSVGTPPPVQIIQEVPTSPVDCESDDDFVMINASDIEGW